MNLNLECARCGKGFIVNTNHLKSIGLNNIPNKCPNCCDVIQQRPVEHRVVDRKVLLEWDAVKICLPDDWFQEYQSIGYNGRPDEKCLRAIVKGEMGEGKSWYGRIDIYDFRSDTKLGHVRLMQVTHERGSVRTERRGSPMDATDQKIEYSPTYEYLSIDPSDKIEPDYALVWVSAYYKTTLKGFGKQYSVKIDTSMSIWSKRMGSCARSGRFGEEMSISIVNDKNYITVEGYGDVKYEKVFSLTDPYGKNL